MRRGLRDRTSLRSNHFASFCIQQCFDAFVARGLLLTSASAETMLSLANGIKHFLNWFVLVQRSSCGIDGFLLSEQLPGQDSYSATLREEIKPPPQ